MLVLVNSVRAEISEKLKVHTFMVYFGGELPWRSSQFQLFSHLSLFTFFILVKFAFCETNPLCIKSKKKFLS